MACAGVTFEVLSSLSYVALFHPVFCPGVAWRISSRIGMSEVGTSALLPSGGAGGLALGAWVLSQRGMSAQKIAARSMAFFLLSSAANVAALAVFGFGLAFGIFDGPAPLGLTLVPALLAVATVPAMLLLPRAAGPRQARGVVPSGRMAAMAARVGAATFAGVQDIRVFLRSGNPLIYLGALGRWGTGRSTTLCCGCASWRSARRRRSRSSQRRTSSANSAACCRCRPESAASTSG